VKKLTTYLATEWSVQVMDNFFQTLKAKLETLSHQPFIGKPSNRKTNTRSLLITKHNRVFYKVDGDVIKIVNMFDTRINPRKNPY
jgi:plasmid stabilization system protein ParE